MKELYLFHKPLNLALTSYIDPYCALIITFISLSVLNKSEQSKFKIILFSTLNCLLAYLLDPSLLILGPLNSALLVLVTHNLYLTKTGSITRILSLLTYGIILFFAKPFFLPILFMILVIELPIDKITSLGLFFLSILSFALSFQTKPIFDYPRNANLVPLSPLTQAGSVDIGVDNLPFTLDYQEYLLERTNVIEILLILSFTALISSLFINKNKIKKRQLLLASLFSLVFYLINDKTLTNYFDLPLLRTIPGLAYLPIPGLVPVFVVFYFLRCLSIQTLALALIIIIPLKGIPSSHQLNSELTPSNYLLEHYTGLIPPTTHKHQQIKLAEFCTASSSINSEEAHLSIDNNNNTRWATKRPQKEGDWLKLSCKHEVSFNELELLIEKSPTDFPRGLSITLDNNNILTLKDWLGPIRSTPKGLPYFGPQHDIDLTFNKKHIFKEMEIKLEKGDDSFDWSIGELKLFEDSL